MATESNFPPGRESLRMKKKRGTIPLRKWNELVDAVFGGMITSVKGGRLCRNKTGSSIEIPTRGWSSGGGYIHPWKIETVTEEEVCKAYVHRAACTVHDYRITTSVVYPLSLERDPVLLDGTPSSSTPLGSMVSAAATIGGTAGYFTLDPETTYGIWLACYPVQQSGITAIGGSTGLAVWQKFEPMGIFADSTYPEPTDSGTATGAGGTYDGLILFHLGKVAVDADGLGTVTQWRRSDVHTQAPLMLIPRIVSLDADNSITGGSDGGAYYNEP